VHCEEREVLWRRHVVITYKSVGRWTGHVGRIRTDVSVEKILLEKLKGRSRCLVIKQGSRTEIVRGPSL
jgi:hypothetical protein